MRRRCSTFIAALNHALDLGVDGDSAGHPWRSRSVLKKARTSTIRASKSRKHSLRSSRARLSVGFSAERDSFASRGPCPGSPKDPTVVKRTLRLAILFAFVGLSLASLSWSVTTYPNAAAPPVTCYKSGRCDYVDQGPQLTAEQDAYNSAVNRQGHNVGMFVTREILLVTVAAIAWVLAGLKQPASARNE